MDGLLCKHGAADTEVRVDNIQFLSAPICTAMSVHDTPGFPHGVLLALISLVPSSFPLSLPGQTSSRLPFPPFMTMGNLVHRDQEAGGSRRVKQRKARLFVHFPDPV